MAPRTKKCQKWNNNLKIARNAVRPIMVDKETQTEQSQDIVEIDVNSEPPPTPASMPKNLASELAFKRKLVSSGNDCGTPHIDNPRKIIGAKRRKLGMAPLEQDIQENSENYVGRRIIPVDVVTKSLQDLAIHVSQCTEKDFVVNPIYKKKEIRSGLNTIIIYGCNCGKEFRVTTDSKKSSLSNNEAAVWGCHTTGIGYNSLASLLTAFDVPVPCYKTFQTKQDVFNESMSKVMKLEMLKWAQKEVELAIAAGDFVQVGDVWYPFITVICDGGWAKRSFGHSYAANCGVAVIIGARTKKIIYADTRIKTCLICTRDLKSGKSSPHTCYKNWDGPSTAMESDIIANGFRKSIEDYGLVYKQFIGDGDSSVHSKIINTYPGLQVRKIECVNHVVRNFTTKLFDIARNQVKGKDAVKIPPDDRRIFNPFIQRLRTALLMAILHHHTTGTTNWLALRDDILNIPCHIFGQHDNCGEYFCKGKDEENKVPLYSKKSFWLPLMKALERVANLASSLIERETSNCAESFMAVANKFMEGKRKNLGQRYLYKLRIAAAVLAYNESTYWAPEAFRIIYEKPPCHLWLRKQQSSIKQRSKPRPYRIKKRLVVPLLSDRKGDKHYGDQPETADMDANVLQPLILELKNSLAVTSDIQKQIEIETRGQSTCPLWFSYKEKRITASQCGKIFRLRDTTDNTATLNSFFKRNVFKGTDEAKKYGLDHENTAIQEYERLNGLEPGSVKPSGLVICVENGLFGCSPDGFVGEDGLVEVKCPHALFLKDASPQEWPQVCKATSSLKYTGKVLSLKTTHDHYYQIIMQLHVTQRMWCDYFVWSHKRSFTERIHRTDQTLEIWNKISLKLEKFWLEDIGPELVDSRYDRGRREYRYPPARAPAIEKKKSRKAPKTHDLIDDD